MGNKKGGEKGRFGEEKEMKYRKKETREKQEWNDEGEAQKKRIRTAQDL
jgi:hypothetical protein